MNNSFGKEFRITVFGGSHESELGVIVEGVSDKLKLIPEDFVGDIARRKPGAKGTTTRVEEDIPIISYYKNTEGEDCIKIVFENKNIRPGDYSNFNSTPRPGHIDFVTHPKRYLGAKSVLEDFPAFTGGGIFSGRMTVALVACGVVAKKYLKSIEIAKNLIFKTDLIEIGGEKDKERWPELLEVVSREGDSIGGIVQAKVNGLPVGLGEPYFDSVESLISHAIFSIPGVRGIEFGDGFKASSMRGSEHNDPFGADGKLLRNGAGGINGGLTNGGELSFRVAFKPTSTIYKGQQTWNFQTKQMEELKAKGRHDVCFALRTPVIVEAMTAVVLAEFFSRISK